MIMNKLGVVIVTYNRLSLLKDCIKHVLEQTYPFSEVVVIDNCSTDGTSEYLSNIKNKINVLKMKKNIGGSGGFYEGIKYILTKDIDWILLIDDDAIINLDFNEKIFKRKLDNRILAYSGVVKINNNIDVNHRRKLIDPHNFKEQPIKELHYKKDFFDYDIATFCGLYVSKSLVERIGLPNKDFFIWYDDTEYSLRFKGITKIRNINSAILDHRCNLENNTKNLNFSWKEYYGRRNKIYILKKYFSTVSYAKYITWLFLAACKHKISYLFLKNIQLNYQYKLCIDALKDGCRERLGKNKHYLP